MKEQSWLEEGWFFHNHAWHLLHEIIKNIPEGTENMLDVGAGTGIAAAIIQAIYPDILITVTDIEKNCVPFWNKRNLLGWEAAGENLPFYDKEFDFAMSSHVLEHSDRPVNFIQEMWRVCKKRLLIVVPDGDCHFYDHKIIYNRTVFVDAINEAIPENEHRKICFPLYHPHINNLIAVIDRI